MEDLPRPVWEQRVLIQLGLAAWAAIPCNKPAIVWWPWGLQGASVPHRQGVGGAGQGAPVTLPSKGSAVSHTMSLSCFRSLLVIFFFFFFLFHQMKLFLKTLHSENYFVFMQYNKIVSPYLFAFHGSRGISRECSPSGNLFPFFFSSSGRKEALSPFCSDFIW